MQNEKQGYRRSDIDHSVDVNISECGHSA